MVAEVAEKLLANPVIESYRVEVDDERSQETGDSLSASRTSSNSAKGTHV